jgi:hypothetical protein
MHELVATETVIKPATSFFVKIIKSTSQVTLPEGTLHLHKAFNLLKIPNAVT